MAMLNQTMTLNSKTRRRRKPEQLKLDLSADASWRGSKGAGRKPAAGRVGLLKHVARPQHDEETPVHVVSRAARGVPYLRSQRLFAAMRVIIAQASEKGFRVLHFSVQANHLHLIVEADDKVALARGIQRLLSRIAMAVNAVARRSGKVWRDRYFRQDLTVPKQVRNALVYVLFNVKKHAQRSDEEIELWRESVDPYSSTPWLDGWSEQCRPPASGLAARFGPPIVAAPRSWLVRDGWKRRGAIRLDEHPRAIRKSATKVGMSAVEERIPYTLHRTWVRLDQLDPPASDKGYSSDELHVTVLRPSRALPLAVVVNIKGRLGDRWVPDTSVDALVGTSAGCIASRPLEDLSEASVLKGDAVDILFEAVTEAARAVHEGVNAPASRDGVAPLRRRRDHPPSSRR